MTDITTIINSYISPILARYSDKTGFRHELREFTDNCPTPGSDRFFALDIYYETFTTPLRLSGCKAFRHYVFVVSENGTVNIPGAPVVSFKDIDTLRLTICPLDYETNHNCASVGEIRFYGAPDSGHVEREMDKLIAAGIPFDVYTYNGRDLGKKCRGVGPHSNYRQRKNGTWKKVA